MTGNEQTPRSTSMTAHPPARPPLARPTPGAPRAPLAGPARFPRPTADGGGRR